MRKQIIYAILLSTTSSLFIFSCQKEINQKEKQREFSSTTNNANGKNENRIYVSDINQLYAAVNDSANVGALVVLEPGIYILSASYLNSGRLELQQDMELQGQPGNPEQVVIDQSALPSTSFIIPPSSRTGGIRIGNGSNTIDWLTVKGNSNALSAIDTDLPSITTQIKIAHVIVGGGQIGIDIRNRLAEHAGRMIEAEIEHNEIVGNTAGFGTGIAIQNANSATGALINTNLNGNYVHGNRVGLRAFNNAASSTVSNSSINIQSTADRFEENGLGIYLNGGISQASIAVATGNSLNFKVHGSSIRYNNPVPTPPEIQVLGQGIPGGIFAVGGNKTTAGNNASNNTLTLNFWGTEISENNGDINAFGAFSSSSTIAGINNLAEINLYGISANAVIVSIPSVPTEPAGTNIVNVFR